MPPKYKPGGRTFPPKSKPSSLPRQTASSIPGGYDSSSSSSSTSLSNGLNAEAEDQLEMELCWCIQQLQTTLDSGKLTEKQTLDTNKTLNVLKSNTAPLIKKRQYMRTTFGDYRTKMSEDKKKHGKNSAQVKFTPPVPNANEKSIFLKKAEEKKKLEDIYKSAESLPTNESSNLIIVPDTNDEPFVFNFTKPNPSIS